MGNTSKLRRWINRDDGRFFQVGNGPVGVWATLGALALVAGMVLWQLHTHLDIDGAFAIVATGVGLILLCMGACLDTKADAT